MIKRYAIAATCAAFVLSIATISSIAAGKSAPKATGGVGYTAYGLERRAEFNAIETTASCSSAWDVTGSYDLTFFLTGDATPYTHDATLTQTGSAVSGSGGYPSGGPHTYEWSITSGSLTGNAIQFTADYTLGADALVPLTTMSVTGTIANNGTMSGTWSDNYQGGARTGTWSTTSGNAVNQTVDCTGKGNFHYSDANGSFYSVDVQYVNVVGDETWFAGPVVSGNVGAGNWLFAKVLDGGTPGRNGDQIWGSFTTESAAKLGVATMSDPGDGPFDVTSGNLIVH